MHLDPPLDQREKILLSQSMCFEVRAIENYCSFERINVDLAHEFKGTTRN